MGSGGASGGGGCDGALVAAAGAEVATAREGPQTAAVCGGIRWGRSRWPAAVSKQGTSRQHHAAAARFRRRANGACGLV